MNFLSQVYLTICLLLLYNTGEFVPPGAPTPVSGPKIACDPPEITQQPDHFTFCPGGSAEFYCLVSGDIDSLRWFQSPDSGVSWVQVNDGGIYLGATADTLHLGAVASALDGYQFQLIAFGCGGPVDSSHIVQLSQDMLGPGIPLTGNFSEFQQRLATDAAVKDAYGFSSSLSHDIAITGAFQEDDGGAAAGAAYILHRDSAGADKWGEVKKLTASDAEPSDNYGFSVSVSGDIAAVGAPRKNDGGFQKGAVYLYYRDHGGPGNWGEFNIIVPTDHDDQDWFGTSVMIEGDVLIVGAESDAAGGTDAGAAYIFYRNLGGPDNWGQVKKLLASSPNPYDFFGTSVSISGDQAVVGALQQDGAGLDAGAAYVFSKNLGGPDNWGQVKKLVGSTVVAGASFGASVSIDGDRILAGAPDLGTGVAYLFYQNKGGVDNWGEKVILTSTDLSGGDAFGKSVFLSDELALVGAPWQATLTGATYLFQKDKGGPDAWGKSDKLTSSSLSTFARFGNSVAEFDGTIMVGAHFEDDAGAGAGSVYFFREDGCPQGDTLYLDSAGTASLSPDSIGAEMLDACGIAGFISSDSSWTCADIGSNIITFTAADILGNTRECSPRIVIQDTMVPLVFCLDLTINLDSSGGAHLTATDLFGGGTDNCGIDTIFALDTTLNCFDAGTGADLSLTVSDASGNTAGCMAHIFFTDTIPPTAACRDVTVDLDLYGNGDLSAEQVDAGSFRACSPEVIPDTFNCDDIGLNTITLLIENVGGLKDSCTASVLVRDFISPTGSNVKDWEEIYSYQHPFPGNGDHLGQSVAIYGDYAIVGAPYFDSVFTDRGQAYLLYRNKGGANNWGRIKTLNPLDPSTEAKFGYAVDIWENLVIVGAHGKTLNEGVAYIFQQHHGGTDNWGQVKKLQAPDLSPGAKFGYAVSLEAGTAVVGAVDGLMSGFPTGIAFLYSRHSGGANNWGLLKKLVPPFTTTPSAEKFGCSIDISGELILIGAFADDAFGSNSGAAYMYAKDEGGTNNWGYKKRLLALVGHSNDQFGTSVALQGSLAVIGAPWENNSTSNAGSAYLFERDAGGSGNWGQIQELEASDTDGNENFGRAVSIQGDWIAVGAHSEDFVGQGNAGAVYLFNENGTGGAWQEAKKLTASDKATSDAMGFSVGLGVNCLVTGAPNKNIATSEQGAAYFFHFRGCPADTSLFLDDTGFTGLPVDSLESLFADACGISTSFLSDTLWDCSEIGIVTSTLISTDFSGNSTHCTLHLGITDTLAPIANCTDLTLYTDSSGIAQIPGAQAGVGSWDNCAIDTFLTLVPFVDCAGLGIHDLSLYVVDSLGYGDSCLFQATVLDTLPPIAVCHDFTLTLDPITGSASLTPAQIDGGSYDACGISSEVLDRTAFTCGDKGPNPISMTLTDMQGNTSTCSVEVTIIENMPPSALCKDLTLQLPASGSMLIPPAGIDAGSSDNCAIDTLIVTPDVFTCANIGPNAAALIVVDPSGNSDFCVSLITVIDSNGTTNRTVNLGPDRVDCSDSIELFGGAFSIFNWNTGESTSNIFVTSPGIWSIEVWDSIGCYGTDTIALTNSIPNEKLLHESGPHPACIGDTITMFTVGDFTEWEWGSGDTSPTVLTTSSGWFYVTVTDTAGCLQTDSHDVFVFPVPKPEVSILPISPVLECVDDTATLTATSGFTGYEWNTLETTGSIEVTVPGPYWVIAYNYEGCTDTSEIAEFGFLPTPTVPPIWPLVGDTLTTEGAFAWQWNLNGSPVIGGTNQWFVPSASGTYTVTVSYANGCSATSEPYPFLVGVNENFQGSVHLYPIPASDWLVVEIELFTHSRVDLRLYDLSGKTLFYYTPTDIKSLYRERITVEQLASGMYFLSIQTDQSLLTKKLKVIK